MMRKGLLALLLGTGLSLAQSGRQELLNAREVGPEIRVAPGREAAVRDHFPSFFDYQDHMLFHPGAGYYARGSVDFAADFGTFPNKLAPYYGRMVAEQIFRMWRGMRQAGTLAAKEQFTIAEFGGGNGSLAESILDYIQRQSKNDPDKRWHEFARQVFYLSYDRSPAMSQAQRERNARFAGQFEARQADATKLDAAIAPGSLKGVILSNELLDNLSVHKVILSADGSVEAAFVAPSVARGIWGELSKYLPPAARASIEKDDRAIRDSVFGGREQATVFLSRAGLAALLEGLAALSDYSTRVSSIQLREVYLPARFVAEVREHLRQYARCYAAVLARGNRGVVAYINLGEARFIRGAARVLTAGYVITVDYGSNWYGLTSLGPYGKLRTFGPGSRQDKPDPYGRPTLNDITTDVNFSFMAAEGELAGLRTVYFGRIKALQSGTPIVLERPVGKGSGTERAKREFANWTAWLQKGRSFKLLVQQKEGTDDSYAYPDHDPEPLKVNAEDLTAPQRTRAAAIEKRLRGEAGRAINGSSSR